MSWQHAGLASFTVLAALLGWATLVVAGREAGPASFAEFMGLWGVFFAVAGLFAGLQQEVTRSLATGPSTASTSRASGTALATRSLTISLAICFVVFGALMVTGTKVVQEQLPLTSLILGLGFVSLGLQSSMAGALAARGQAARLGAMIFGSAILRLVGVGVVVSHPSSPAWAAAIALGALMWVPMAVDKRSRNALASRATESMSSFVRAALPTMVGSLLAGLLTAGLPVLIRSTGSATPTATEGVLLAAIVAVRTPMLFPLAAFQLPLLRHLVSLRTNALVDLYRWLRWAGVVSVLVIAAAGLVGERALGILFGAEYQLPGSSLACIALGSSFLLALTLTNLALLALQEQVWALIGWVVALVTTLLALVAADDLTLGVLSAVTAGPLIGLIVQILRLELIRRRPNDG